jgi:hypothetical protein
MDDRPTLTVSATPEPLPDHVDRARWPVHVTVLGNFRVDAGALPRLERRLADTSPHGPVVVELGPPAGFGPTGAVPVLLAAHPTFRALHDQLATDARTLDGFEPVAPEFWADGYRPHATLGPAVVLRDGAVLTFRYLTLVVLDGMSAQAVRTVRLAGN